MPTSLHIYLTFLFALTGAVMGSFLNCWAQRYAQGERYPRGRSVCPRCGHTLGALELVPVLSWIFLRGRCRSCHEPISVRYPLTELAGALALAGTYLRFGLTARTAEVCILTACLFILALIDYDTMLLPGTPMLVALASWGVFRFFDSAWRTTLLQGGTSALALGAFMLVLSLVMDRLLGRESLGGGDIKLLALCALYLGWWKSLLMLILSCVLGLLFAALRGARGRQFPFGPAICAATWLTLLAGDPVVEWYLGLF